MSKKACLEASEAALSKTAEANDKNTAEAHGEAASFHKIAAEHAKLNEDDAAHAKHKDLAEQHDLAASRCSAAAGNKVAPKDGSAVPVLANASHAEPTFGTVKAYVAKLNELSAARMSTLKPLEAALAGAGWSINDLREDATKAVMALDICKPKEGTNTICGWISDIIAPEEEAGETWNVVFTGNDGKLYTVTVSVGDDVKVVGEPEEIQRTSDYDYVKNMEAEARKASGAEGIEAANVSDTAAKKSAAALSATNAAHAASKAAEESGTKESHKAAGEAHEEAHGAHSDAAKANLAAGSHGKVVDEHLAAMATHKEAKADHDKKCVACEESEGATEAASSVQARVLVHTCHNELQASGCNPDLDGVRHEVLRLHGVDLTCEQVGEYLAQPLEASGKAAGDAAAPLEATGDALESGKTELYVDGAPIKDPLEAGKSKIPYWNLRTQISLR